MEISNGLGFKVRTGKRSPVEVTIFEDPSRRSWCKKAKTMKQNSEKNEAKEEDFNEMLKDVKDFGATGFSKKERKKFEEQKALALGARKSKNQKVPYPILQYAAKVRKEREAQKKELEKEMGIFSKKKTNQKNKATKKQNGWWTNKPVKIDSSRNNINIKKSDFERISKSSK